jgi:hypothetical protein
VGYAAKQHSKSAARTHTQTHTLTTHTLNIEDFE